MAECIFQPAQQVEEGGILMSLINQMMEKCNILNRARVDDDYGGYKETWTVGASFDATIIKNSSTEAVIAEKQGVAEIFTVVTSKKFVLAYNDVFMRASDSQVFRVTGNDKDSEAPSMSTVQISKVTAEKWVIPE